MVSTQSSSPTKLLAQEGFNLDKFRESKEAQALVDWVKSEYAKAKAARTRVQTQWYLNMSMFYGRQWVERTSNNLPGAFRDRLTTPRKPYYKQRKVINRTRSFVRWELSKFLARTPTVDSVPSTGEDQDIRAAYAAEQAWMSISSAGHVKNHYSRAALWTILTGNGFMKTQWDQTATDPVSGQPGNIKFGSVTPFHLFVPDLREQEIDDQPYLINAYVRPVEWCYHYFAEELKGKKLEPSVTSANQVLEEGHLNLGAARGPDSVVVYETWVKPGATKLLPNGGLIVSVDDILMSVFRDGLPYGHGQYPFTKFEHIPTATFYADSPLVDLNNLQKEYNELRSDIAQAGKVSAKPQLLAARGSVVPSKITNEPGLVIEYLPGYAPPQPLPMNPLPQYYVEQQDRILNDWEDISGEKEVTRGSAPAGVSAGTAINYLQEAANSYLTPQFQSIEQGWERMATQTIGLFVQYVDLPRKIKTVGADGAFDTLLLQGSDIATGTDMRTEAGSSVGQSKAALEARAMDMFSIGMIDQPMALKLMEVNGFQKMQDLMNVAERKAQRENTKMKQLKAEDLQAAAEEQLQQVTLALQAESPEMLADPAVLQELQNLDPPLMIPVDDFDVHEIHVDTHNKFRMSQEYETLADEVKKQFELHVQSHNAFLQQQQIMMALQADPMAVEGDPSLTPEGQDSGEMMGPGASMADNGAVPEAPTTEGGI